MREVVRCIDAGTEYCPCHLAEANECIVCSELQNRHCCDCLNWNGVCIYNEFIKNGSKPKKGRQTYNCLVTEKILHQNDVLLIKFKAPHKLALDLVRPGGFVFIRTDENIYFDVPISILESDVKENIITIMIEVRGIKTKKLLEIKTGGEITIRGPYWNGVFGLDNINEQKNNNVLVIARGIGMAPMVPVIKKLAEQNNNIDLVLDKAPFNENYASEFIKDYNVNIIDESIIDRGDLTDEIRVIIKEQIKNRNINYIHVAGADILTFKIMDFLDSIGRDDIKLSCCNNIKMCCGEGVCGSCTARFSGRKVKRLCKTQVDPRNAFEGRRFI